MLTKIPNQMIKPEGAPDQTSVVIRDGVMQTVQASEIVGTEVIGGRFDAISGVLTINFFDGSTKIISNFPTEARIPAGPTGPQGIAGEDGIAGANGRDGLQGSPGCAGVRGLIGLTGPRGESGRTGQQGPVGPEGPMGVMGLQGPPGATGPRGNTGPKGRRGDKGARGRPGPAGEEGFMNIVVSVKEPEKKEHGMLWVNPEADYVCGYVTELASLLVPEVIDDMSDLVCGVEHEKFMAGPKSVNRSKRMQIIIAFMTRNGLKRCPTAEQFLDAVDYAATHSTPELLVYIQDGIPEADANAACVIVANRKVGYGKYGKAEYINGSGNRCKITY